MCSSSGRQRQTMSTSSRRTSGVVSGSSWTAAACSPFFVVGSAGLRSHSGQVGPGEQGQRDMPVPGIVAADLILVQPDFLLADLNTALDAPARASHLDQRFHRGIGPPEGNVVGEPLGFGDASANQKPVSPPPLRESHQANQRPIVNPGALGPLATGEPLPGFRWQGGGHAIRTNLTGSAALAYVLPYVLPYVLADPDRLATGYAHDEGLLPHEGML